MANDIQLNVEDLDPEIRDQLAQQTPGTEGTMTIGYVVTESSDAVFAASVKSASDISASEAEGEDEFFGDGDAADDLPPPSLVVLARGNGSSEES
ncbi:MAG: hypothetical protein JRJ68_03295 [Deltaproteobacteria bacterium]|nr:hypothetical protein [Deltaproteobacteria bacterium]